MIKKLLILIVASGAISLYAEEKCVYSYKKESAALQWTAFKFTERMGVKGRLTDVQIAADNSASLDGLLASASFKIKTSGVNSDNSTRDEKIYKYFFKTMKGGKKLKGHVEKSENGKMSVILDMNGIKKSFPADYGYNKGKLIITAAVNTSDWDSAEAVKLLNQNCSGMHAGKDGKTRLWPDVELVLTADVTKTCN